MDTERAYQIIKSPDCIEVMYNNNPVWIDYIDRSKDMAAVRLLDSNERLEVPVGQLEETGRSIET
jgi:small acid-soluble spore protein H (minor)